MSADEALDDLAGLRALLDQVCASLGEHAHLVATYYQRLLEAGMPEEGALVLTVYFQTSYLQSILSADGGDGDPGS